MMSCSWHRTLSQNENHPGKHNLPEVNVLTAISSASAMRWKSASKILGARPLCMPNTTISTFLGQQVALASGVLHVLVGRSGKDCAWLGAAASATSLLEACRLQAQTCCKTLLQMSFPLQHSSCCTTTNKQAPIQHGAKS